MTFIYGRLVEQPSRVVFCIYKDKQRGMDAYTFWYQPIERPELKSLQLQIENQIEGKEDPLKTIFLYHLSVLQLSRKYGKS